MKKDFYIGLDVGTNSVGWAATDEEFKVLRLKGKDAWGSRLFEEASDAKARRGFRSSKRRIARRKYRINELNNLMAPLISPTDSTFFVRLSESAYQVEGDSHEGKHSHPGFLFLNKEQEKEYYKRYPTIYHLRAALMNNDEYAFSDIRYVYLAIHHILKYRGNFLKEGDIDPLKFDNTTLDRLNDVFRQLKAEADEIDIDECDYEFLSKDKYNELIYVLTENKEGKTSQQKAIKQFTNKFEGGSTCWSDVFITYVTGGNKTIKLDNGEDTKVEINVSKFDDKIFEWTDALGETASELLRIGKEIYDYVYVKNLIGNNKTISSAFVAYYEKHKKDLKDFKDFIIKVDELLGNKKESSRLYYSVFKDKNSKENYNAYINNRKDCSIDTFNKFVEKTLKDIPASIFEDPNNKKLKTMYDCIISLCADREFLSLIAYKSTSAIPNQLHKNELRIILDNAKKHYPKMGEINDKIIQLFEFRVPYYYGPLSGEKSHVVLKEGVTEKVNAYNYKEIVDDGETKAKFMRSLTNECSVLRGEKVLPRQSIVFSDYLALNLLNALKIDGQLITVELKKELFDNLVTKRQRTSVKDIAKYLHTHYPETYDKNVTISGIDSDQIIDCSSRNTFSGTEIDINTDSGLEVAERIIFLLTIFCDNKSDAKKAIKEEFPKLSDSTVNKVSSLNCQKWAAFSRKLLTGIYSVDDNGVALSVLEVLYNENVQLNELIKTKDSKYGFVNAIEEHNKEYYGERTDEDKIEEIIENTPPKMRRSVIQSIRIVDEVASIAGQAPSYICIETTRENDKDTKKGKTTSRKKQLEDFLKGLTGSEEILKELSAKEESELRGDHLYLYFLQNGYDLYTGKKIDIEDVLDSTKYDIDHIYPQSLILDNSLNNKVLVSREANQKIKKDFYPIPEQIRCNKEVVQLWKSLKASGILSSEKYSRLVRSSELTEEELDKFVSAQINVVNHSNVVIRDILQIKYPHAKLVFTKASNTSFMRQYLDIPKYRELNDCHHAIDAYMTIVQGTLLDKKYSNLRSIKIREKYNSNSENSTYNPESYLEHVFKKDDGKLGNLIKNNCGKHSFLLTYKNTYSNDAFYDQTIYGRGVKGDSALVPLHTREDNPLSNASKYGGYSSLSCAYLVPVTLFDNKKKKTLKILCDVPILYTSKSETEIKNCIVNSISKIYGAQFSNCSVIDIDLSTKIYNNQKVVYKNSIFTLSNGNQKQLLLRFKVPIFLSNEDTKYLKLLEKHADKLTDVTQFDYRWYTDKEQKNEKIISKSLNKTLLEHIVNLNQNPIFDLNAKVHEEIDWETFENSSINDQCKFIKNKMEEYYIFLQPRKSTILNEGLTLVYDSVTGLYSKKVEI